MGIQGETRAKIWLREHIFVKGVISRIPFIGSMQECSRKDILQALAEVGLTTLFSTMPLWVLPVLGWFLFKSNNSMLANTYQLVSDGELFLYAAACLGPLVYIISKRYGEYRAKDKKDWPVWSISFPYGPGFVLFSFAICMVCGFVFGLIRLPEAKVLREIIDGNKAFSASIMCYGIALVLLFFASAYRNALENFERNGRVTGEGFDDDPWQLAKRASLEARD